MGRARLVAVAGAVALALGGCGDDDGGGGGGDALSKADITAEANKICTARQEETADIAAPDDFADPKVAAEYFNQVAPVLQKEVDALTELEPDDAVKADWNAFIDAETAANGLLQQITEKANAADRSGLKDLTKLPKATLKVNDAATKVGATACAA